MLAVGNVPSALARPGRRQEERLAGAAGRCLCWKRIRRQSVRAGSAIGMELPRRDLESLDDAVSWGLERARTVIVRTLGTVFYWAGDRPSDWADYDVEGGLRSWPPSAAERRAIDAAYEAEAAAAHADSVARDAYEYARLGWLLEHVPDLAECEPAYECVMKLPGDDQRIEFEELDPGGTVCGARRQGTGAYGFGSAGQALAARSGPAADDRWVAAVCAALARERTWRMGRRPSLLVKEGSGEMFHVTATENRQSILRHGLDWRQMGLLLALLEAGSPSCRPSSCARTATRSASSPRCPACQPTYGRSALTGYGWKRVRTAG